MKRSWSILFAVGIAASVWGCAQKGADKHGKTDVTFIKSYNQVHVLAGGKHFTSLLYDTSITQPNGRPLMKPILYPVYSPSGIRMQRQYPLKNVEEESHDHPHHEGVFFTYGSEGEVNGNSFWQNQQGATRIRQAAITQMKTSEGKATFAANPLGQSIYQKQGGVKNPKPLNYTIPAGGRALFKFKMIIYEGHQGKEQIENIFQKYSS